MKSKERISAQQGRLSRHKVSVGEPADGSPPFKFYLIWKDNKRKIKELQLSTVITTTAEEKFKNPANLKITRACSSAGRTLPLHQNCKSKKQERQRSRVRLPTGPLFFWEN